MITEIKKKVAGRVVMPSWSDYDFLIRRIAELEGALLFYSQDRNWEQEVTNGQTIASYIGPKIAKDALMERAVDSDDYVVLCAVCYAPVKREDAHSPHARYCNKVDCRCDYWTCERHCWECHPDDVDDTEDVGDGE